MNRKMNETRDDLFYQLVNIFNDISTIKDVYYKNIEKEKLFQLISFVIFRNDVFKILFRLFELEASNIYEKILEFIFEDKNIDTSHKEFNSLKNTLFKLAGYHYNEINNSLFDIHHLIKVIKLKEGQFYIKVNYVKSKNILIYKDLYMQPNYSNIPFSFKNKKIKILKTYVNLPEEIKEETIKLVKKVSSIKQQHLSIKDVKCTDLKRKFTILYLFNQIKRKYPHYKKQEHIAILRDELKLLNKKIKMDLIKKCKILKDKFDKNIVYKEAKILYEETHYPSNKNYIWGELNKYEEAIKFYNEDKK